MAQYDFAPQLTRIHTTNAGQNIHLEMFSHDVDTKFKRVSLFDGLTQKRVTLPNTNTFRLDRLGASEVKARQVGDKLEPQKVPNNKLTVVLDKALYIQNNIDFMDDWTSPDYRREIASNNASVFARDWDTAHVIQLLHCRTWKAPAELKANGVFFDGTEVTANIKAAPANRADHEANAMAIANAHAKAVESLITRDIPLQNMVTIVKPEIYSLLMNHPTLINKDFSVGNGDYANRRVMRLNGIDIVEANCFPTAAGNHTLHSTVQPELNMVVTADDLKYGMVVFDKGLSLIDIIAKDFHTSHVAREEEQIQYLTTVAMKTVVARRPDTVVPVKVVAA